MNKKLSIGIIRFPCSNCDFDALTFFRKSGHKAEFIWYKDAPSPRWDMLVIPGGFAFGDRVYEKATHSYEINPGEQAMKSPVMKTIYEAAKKKIPILGICNGFQILVKAGLLPGQLEQNESKKFFCDITTCEVVGNSFFNDASMLHKTYQLPVAHGYGKYVASKNEIGDLKKNDQIFLVYKNTNPNGSIENIAGICNKDKTIYGLMPHPERSVDGKYFSQAIERYFAQASNSIASQLQETMASEHTSYASTKKYLRNLPTKGKYVLQGPGENAGIVDLGQGYALAMRIESHNHPSFIKPYHGAATGVGGILRDIFTMGARPIATLDFLRFGIDTHAKQLLKEVVHGIADYGNCVGVPTVGGDVYFDSTYNQNCLVNVAAFGLLKKSQIIYGNALTPQADLIYVGAKTGNDGIGGAQMASENMNATNTKAIQEADPFLEKLLLEACIELAETDWIEGMQDMGAAGLLCSTSEVILRGRKKTKKSLGAKIYLQKVPLKLPYMPPVDMLLSETQERMLIVGKKKDREKILSLFKRWDLEACVIGEVTNDGKYTLEYRDEKKQVQKVSMEFNDVFGEVEKIWELLPWKTQHTSHTKAPTSVTKPIWQQYDWSVGVRTLKGPNQPGHYAILDIPEINKEVIITWGNDEGISDKDARKGIEYAFDTCYNMMKKLKATPLGLTNCLNFGHPKESIGAFAKTIEGLSERCKKYNVPVVGGNVSLYNAYENHSIKPTPILVMAGVREKIQ